MEIHNIIDSARDILVGKLPNPQDQIDTITYTLMYKFMSDIDDESASLGGKRVYFQGDYEKYDWHNLMRSDGQQQLILFRDAIESMNKNPNLPQLFREIFSGALLKFNDPRTLRLFLKEMDKFTHGENDDLGDAYEYLLSIMSSQGGLGQFRTPRHIIEFIVQLVNPDKDNKIIDPACGTSGFLIAAYKHIMAMHDGKDSSGQQNNEQRLTAQELERIHKNFRGFDIDPTMIRTARVNMYLHGFKTPDIIEHDTLTSEDYWNDKYDIILANPPFMTPKGGIQPHKKFSVQANRSEVLFTDYIATHLKPRGRAGFIVPEGIIFQSGNAYKQLRKNLVEQNGLVAVISLPGGVFLPYSGVKTDILLLDTELAKTKNDILFIKIENDGYSLSQTRSKIKDNQLPQALEDIENFKKGLKISNISFSIPKTEILNDKDVNLTGERYRQVGKTIETKYEIVSLGNHITEQSERVKNNNEILVWSVSNKNGFIDPDTQFSKRVASEDTSNYKVVRKNYFAYNPARINVGSIALNQSENIGCVSPMYVVFSIDETKLDTNYLFSLIKHDTFHDEILRLAQGAVRSQLKFNDLRLIQIPLPPLSVQKEIVAKIAVKQKAIEAAREVIANLQKERAYFNPRPAKDWKIVKLGEVAEINEKTADPVQLYGKNAEVSYIDISSVNNNFGGINEIQKIMAENAPSRARRIVQVGDTLISTVRPNLRAFTILKDLPENPIASTGFAVLHSKDERLTNEWLYYAVSSLGAVNQMEGMMGKGAYPSINQTDVSNIEIVIPPLAVQQEYVEMFQKEQAIITANKACIAMMNERIKDTLSELYDN